MGGSGHRFGWAEQGDVHLIQVENSVDSPSKKFQVASVSVNTNSFGLYGMILMAQDGETWQVGANSLNRKDKGDVLEVVEVNGHLNWASHGFEIPEKLPQPPQKVIDEVWEQIEA